MDEPVWLNRTIVEAVHADQVREHGGQLGMRDPGLLDSALARPRHVWTYEADADLARLAAEYGFGVAKTHPFVDGNKRVALVAIDVFLACNGYTLRADNDQAYETIMALARGELERDELVAWVKKHAESEIRD